MPEVEVTRTVTQSQSEKNAQQKVLQRIEYTSGKPGTNTTKVHAMES